MEDEVYGEQVLTGRRALVVGGGGGGSGRAISRAVARAGASVAVVDIDPAAAEEAAAGLVAAGTRAVGIAADVRDQADVDRVVARTVDELGGLDVVVLVVGGFNQHTWSVGDTVMWDNTGTLHRAMPYDPASRREMHRTTIVGSESIT